MDKIKSLIVQHKDFILYGIFGVLTTLVEIGAYWCCASLLNLSVVISTIIAWVIAVLFTYVTNRKYVFSSNAHNAKEILKEFSSFIVCRLATGGLDVAIMFVFVDLLSMNDIIIKVAANVVVIIVNYIASKLIIFKKGDST